MKLLYIHIFPVTSTQANIIQVLQMCHAFQKLGVDVTLALPENNTHVDSREIIREQFGISANFNIENYRKYTIGGRLESLGAYRGINNLLQNSSEFDCCYVRDSFIARMTIKRGFTTIFEQHDIRLHPNKILNWLYSKIFIRYIHSEKLLKIVAISNALAGKLIKHGIPKNKICVLHDGVNVDDYNEPRSRFQARGDLGISIKNKLAIYVGSLYEDRGIENILRVAKSFPRCNFIVVGGPNRFRIQWESKSKDQGVENILFTGRVPHSQVKTYLFAADILLMLWSRSVPTIDVCSPLKLFEYMASGRIILGHGFSTIREVVKDGETAILTDPDSTGDLERKIGYALKLKYPNEIAENARQLAFTKYSWTKRAQSILEVLGPKDSHPFHS